MICTPPVNVNTYGLNAARTRTYCGHEFDGQLTQRYSRSIAGLMEFPPVVHTGVVYTATDSGSVTAFAASDGHNLWHVNIGGIAADSPTYLNGRLFVASRGSGAGGFTALSAATGKTLWRRTGWTGESSPSSFGRWICTANTGGTAGCFAGEGGRMKWSIDTGCKVTGALARVGSFFYLGTYCGRVLKIGGYHGRVVWDAPACTGAIYGNVAVQDGHVVAPCRDSNAVVSLDAQTGARQWRASTGGQAYASPAVTPTAVYAAGRNGTLVRVSLATGVVTWSTTVDGLVMGSPVVVGNRVFFSVMGPSFKPGQVLGYRVGTMARAFTFTTDGRYTPVVPDRGDGLLWIVGETHLFAFAKS